MYLSLQYSQTLVALPIWICEYFNMQFDYPFGHSIGSCHSSLRGSSILQTINNIRTVSNKYCNIVEIHASTIMSNVALPSLSSHFFLWMLFRHGLWLSSSCGLHIPFQTPLQREEIYSLYSPNNDYSHPVL